MGSAKKLIISATGFPGTNKTLRFIQDGFREPLGALANLAGHKTIVSGVGISELGRVRPGFISYNNEIIPFVTGDYADTVTIIEEFENVNYNTDANDDTILDSLPAYRTIYAKCGTGGIDTFNFSELTRLKTFRELANLELPSNILTYLYKGSITVATGNTGGVITVSFPDVGTNNYLIVQSSKSLTGNIVYAGNFSPDNYTASSFDANMPNLADAFEGSVIFNFMLIKLD